ncbi:carbohydrate kinase [Rhizobiales bacterium]|uniref:carbohydrate kinase family protein n=1 Tax=Hongsoonwoonella zoysiae TaxID=2821844 RepID=UPI00155FBD68|nr:carbohydrate kinase [Hongsoonwoonella zoysiae]NRG16593.1 carbohydrate kinase [Hongsoonwoonella zoysiae]
MILVCGEALFDLFAEETATGFQIDARIGGSPFNVAVGLSRLETQAAFFSGLSTDLFGRRLRQALKSEGVDLRFAVQKNAPTTLSVVSLGPDGSPEYAFNGEGAADRLIETGDLPKLDDKIEAIHLGSFSALVEPVGMSVLDLVRRESARRVISYDPNIRPTVVPDMESWRARLEELLDHVHILKISAEDLENLYSGADRVTLAASWIERGVRLVIVTDGGKGAYGFTAGRELHVPGRTVDVADTVGAGDSFQAALLAALSRKGLLKADRLRNIDVDTLSAILSFAVDAAAITCSRRGADLPSLGDLASLQAQP